MVEGSVVTRSTAPIAAVEVAVQSSRAIGPKILLYSHDTFGLGNIHRTLLVAEALTGALPAAAVLIVTGSPVIHALRIPDGMDYVKLPCLDRLAAERCQPRFLSSWSDDVKRLRPQDGLLRLSPNRYRGAPVRRRAASGARDNRRKWGRQRRRGGLPRGAARASPPVRSPYDDHLRPADAREPPHPDPRAVRRPPGRRLLRFRTRPRPPLRRGRRRGLDGRILDRMRASLVRAPRHPRPPYGAGARAAHPRQALRRARILRPRRAEASRARAADQEGPRRSAARCRVGSLRRPGRAAADRRARTGAASRRERVRRGYDVVVTRPQRVMFVLRKHFVGAARRARPGIFPINPGG